MSIEKIYEWMNAWMNEALEGIKPKWNTEIFSVRAIIMLYMFEETSKISHPAILL